MVTRAQFIPLLQREVPVPSYPLVIPEGAQWLRGQLIDPSERFKLDDQFIPPGIYKTVRNDISQYADISCTRIALSKHNNEYIGVIDSNGDPYFFSINSMGMTARKADDPEAAWKIFDELMTQERKVGLDYRREKANDDLKPLNKAHRDVESEMLHPVVKALPRKDKTSKDRDAKKTPSKKSSSKKAGKNGKTRYNYPQDKKQKTSGKEPGASDQNGPQKVAERTQQQKESGGDPITVPRQQQPKSVDPQQVANQMQLPVHTLKHVAERFVENEKLGGRSGFVKFMKTRLKDFAEKHKLDGDFFGLLFDALTQGMEKAVVAMHQPGKRGGKWHFDGHGKPVYDSHQKTGPSVNWHGKFDATAFNKQIEEHRYTAQAHTARARELKGKIDTLSQQPPNDVGNKRLEKLKAEHKDHTALAAAARSKHKEAKAALTTAQAHHREAQQQKRSNRQQFLNRQRESVHVIGVGQRMRGADDDDTPVTPTRAIPTNNRHKVSEDYVEPKFEEKKEEAPKPRGTTSIWQPGDDDRERARQAKEAKEKKPTRSFQEEYEDNKRRANERHESERRARERFEKQKPKQQEEAKPGQSGETEKPSAEKKPGIFSKLKHLFYRKDFANDPISRAYIVVPRSKRRYIR